MALSNRRIHVVVAFALFLILIIRPGNCYRCYECDSKSDENCANLKEKKYVSVRECNTIVHYSNHPVGCKKVIKKTDEGIQVERGCLSKADEEQYFSKPSEPCKPVQYSSDYWCHCYGDLCNGSPQRANNYWPMIVSAFLFFLAIRWQ